MIPAAILKDGSVMTKDDIEYLIGPYYIIYGPSVQATDAFVNYWFELAQKQLLSEDGLNYEHISMREYFEIFTDGYDARAIKE